MDDFSSADATPTLPVRQLWARQRASAQGNADAILRAARDLVAADGVVALDVRQVARRAGVGVGTVYRRFGDKAGVLAALLDEPERDLQDRLLTGPPPLGPGAPPLDRLCAFLDALVALTDEHLELLLAVEAAAPDARLRVGAYAAWRLHVATLIRERQPDADAEWLATLLLAPFDAELFRDQRQRLGRSPAQLRANLRRAVRALV